MSTTTLAAETAYLEKDAAYFGFVRRDIEPLLAPRAGRVLELGCGQGGTLGWLRRSGRAAHTTGVELCQEAASAARNHADEVIHADLDRAIEALPAGSFELVLCLDVLEHLVDPWATLARVQPLLAPGAALVVSLPNVRHYSVVVPLLLSGQWEYRDAGIMDRTHLRFFSRRGAIAMIEQAGLRVTHQLDCGHQPRRLRESWKRLVAASAWRDLVVSQFLIRAEKAA